MKSKPMPYNLRGDEMTEKNTQQPLGVASELNAELDVFTTIPTETGLWLCSCDDGEWCPVIIHTGKNGELMVTETIGTYPLDAYHSNLMKWKKAKIKHPLTTDA